MIRRSRKQKGFELLPNTLLNQTDILNTVAGGKGFDDTATPFCFWLYRLMPKTTTLCGEICLMLSGSCLAQDNISSSDLRFGCELMPWGHGWMRLWQRRWEDLPGGVFIL